MNITTYIYNLIIWLVIGNDSTRVYYMQSEFNIILKTINITIILHK